MSGSLFSIIIILLAFIGFLFLLAKLVDLFDSLKLKSKDESKIESNNQFKDGWKKGWEDRIKMENINKST